MICQLAKYSDNDKVKAVIGPFCSETIEAAGHVAEYLQLPMVTGLRSYVNRDKGADKTLKHLNDSFVQSTEATTMYSIMILSNISELGWWLKN